VAVDDRPVDPDRLRDLVDLGVPHAGAVEQGAGGADDLGLTLAAAGGGGRTPAVTRRSLLCHAARLVQHPVAHV
jgi:hypothetical protein